jgi:RecJ-like exonuclease
MATCSRCGGSGRITCEACNGTGKTKKEIMDLIKKFPDSKKFEICVFCKGTGRRRCPDYFGTGQE